ncbi:helix-turn-helix domain-containing protein [Rhodococcus sp. IEGM 1366]|uniref:IclR family transcriptional regulator n=1 Tax=Rhodococcus sp. IEGM 1366 TaxID=3082223 RepID=UPI002953612D|nr:helix-turn-helix domain-containing protein [Rhodococcus sp. IEGM 1366]MDV8070965.1 helix-turn-helix domain-containing protein [Rhodococcus sp. IEGM 1366]
MSTSARRALQVLDYLSVNERGTFTLSELARALKISPGSMFAILQVMAEGGYVSRHPRHKTYTLGPAVAAAGHAASVAHPVIELARAEMINLAAVTGHECSGTVLVGKDVLCIAVEGKPTGFPVELAPGQRVPLLPPLGQPFMAWMPPAELEDWIATIPSDLQKRVADYIKSHGPIVKQRGYSIGIEILSATRPDVTRELAERPNDPRVREAFLQQFFERQDNFAVREFDANSDYIVGNIAAPVFDPDGRVVFSLTMAHIGRLRGSEIPAAAQPVSASAQLLTRQIGGRTPTPGWNRSRDRFNGSHTDTRYPLHESNRQEVKR